MLFRVQGSDAAAKLGRAVQATYDQNLGADVWIYSFEDETGRTRYVGSSFDPLKRWIIHSTGRTADTRAWFSDMLQRGHLPTLTVRDLTVRMHRYAIEARWIDELQPDLNTMRYLGRLGDYIRCPDCFRSLTDGTLNRDHKIK